MSLPDWLAGRSRPPAPAGSVLLHAPAAAFQAPGGGECQLVQTARALETRGVPVALFNPWADSIASARLLHLFGISPEGLSLARIANARGIPVALSTICWYEPRALAALAGGAVRGGWALAKWGVKRAYPRWPSWRRELLARANILLPNSHAEAEQLVRLFAIDPGKIRVVPNGVEPRFADADPAPFRDWSGLSECVLYVGRLEPRKNVLGLVRALRKKGLPLAVIGEAVPGRETYAAACREVGAGWARFLGGLSHDDPRLAGAYATARVVALPSWFETPGLAVLEGALAGCAGVVTPYGCTREYFGDRVQYARPDRGREITAAVGAAWDSGPAPGLREAVRDRFLWPEVARLTREAYDAIAA
jgi:glycosyltransferase involved in cell wall biosynthesis